MAIYDFICNCGEVIEARVGQGVDALPCPCGQNARRSSVYQVAIGTKEKQYRVSDVVEASQELDYAHTAQEQREGRKLKWRSPYKAAMRKVRHSTR
jgi:hypothetical protein